MKFDHSKLLGRIREFGLTQEKVAHEMGINKGTLGAKLGGKYSFTTDEIDKLCMLLDISFNEIGEYFFAKRVWKSNQ